MATRKVRPAVRVKERTNERSMQGRGSAQAGRGSGRGRGRGSPIPQYGLKDGNNQGYQQYITAASGEPARMVAGGQHHPRHWTPTPNGQWQPAHAQAQTLTQQQFAAASFGNSQQQSWQTQPWQYRQATQQQPPQWFAPNVSSPQTWNNALSPVCMRLRGRWVSAVLRLCTV